MSRVLDYPEIRQMLSVESIVNWEDRQWKTG